MGVDPILVLSLVAITCTKALVDLGPSQRGGQLSLALPHSIVLRWWYISPPQRAERYLNQRVSFVHRWSLAAYHPSEEWFVSNSASKGKPCVMFIYLRNLSDCKTCKTWPASQKVSKLSMHPRSILPDPFAPQLARNEESLGILCDTVFTMSMTHIHIDMFIPKFFFQRSDRSGRAANWYHRNSMLSLFRCISSINFWSIARLPLLLWRSTVSLPVLGWQGMSCLASQMEPLKTDRALGWWSCLCVQCSNWFHEASCAWGSAKSPRTLFNFINFIMIHLSDSMHLDMIQLYNMILTINNI